MVYYISYQLKYGVVRRKRKSKRVLCDGYTGGRWPLPRAPVVYSSQVERGDAPAQALVGRKATGTQEETSLLRSPAVAAPSTIIVTVAHRIGSTRLLRESHTSSSTESNFAAGFGVCVIDTYDTYDMIRQRNSRDRRKRQWPHCLNRCLQSATAAGHT